MRQLQALSIWLLCGILLLAGATVTASEPVLQLAIFRADVTPSLGDGPCVGAMPKVTSVEHPLEMRGVVLRSHGETYVIAAIDFCGICNTSDDAIRAAMAKAAGTIPERVALQSLHQHTAPILDADAVRLLHGDSSPELTEHLKFTDLVAARAGEAISASLIDLKEVSRIRCTRSKVEQVAANRRVPQPDGSIAVRTSLTRELGIRNAPEGLIDPWLRTLTFFQGVGDRHQPLVQLHYYATHPQTFYGDARISWDCVGMAREEWEKESGIPQIYFTGCAGNVTLGKYNEGTRDSRQQIATRLRQAMERSIEPHIEDALTVDVAALTPAEITWAAAPIRFTVRETGTFDPELLQRQLAHDQPFNTRLTAAMFIGFSQRLRGGYVPMATRWRIGPIDIVHLPGEPFVEFQLFAQEHAAKGTFPCVAGYGECGVWYYGPDQIFKDRGGYEQTWSLAGPCQAVVESALVDLLHR